MNLTCLSQDVIPAYQKINFLDKDFRKILCLSCVYVHTYTRIRVHSGGDHPSGGVKVRYPFIDGENLTNNRR